MFKSYAGILDANFSKQEVEHFDNLLKSFEKNVSVFSQLYPESVAKPGLRKAVIDRYTSVYDQIQNDKVVIIAVLKTEKGKLSFENRYLFPGCDTLSFS